MATVQVRLGAYEDEQVVFYMEYDDTTLVISAVRVINNTALNVVVTVVRNQGHVTYSRSFPPGETVLNFPTTGGQRVTLADLGRGHWGNVQIGSGYPG